MVVEIVVLTIFALVLVSGMLLFCLFFIQNLRAKRRSEQIESEINSLRKKILVVTGNTVPGKKILKVLGAVRAVSDTQASSRQEFDLAEKEAMKTLMTSAISLSANAIIDVRLSTGTYQKKGSQWQVSQSVYTGTAVQIN